MNYSRKLRKCIKAIIATFIAIITLLSTSTLANAAENYDGSWAYSYESQSVYSDYTGTNKIGTVYAYEGFTVLYHTAGHPYIEYSTSNGAKRGYILGSSIAYMNPSCVAKVIRTSTLYYGNNTSVYQASGTVYSGEFVAVLAKNDSWVYVEYNTNSGRKRGYMQYSNLECYNRPGVFKDLYMYANQGYRQYVSGTYNVRSGPSTQYPTIGSISNESVLVLDSYSMDGVNEWSYIEYYVNGTSQKKSGFALIN